jgi:hypothetical protein
MKTPKTTTIKLGLAVISFSTALMFFAFGCGGGGGGVTASSAVPADSDNVKYSYDGEVAYDIDLDSDGITGYTAASVDSYSSTTSGILSIKAYIESLPSKAFRKVSKNDVKLAMAKQKRLERIVGEIRANIKRGGYAHAAKLIQRKLVPRVDGCNGGAAGDDYIVECANKTNVYQTAVQMLDLLSTVPRNSRNGNNVRSAAASVNLNTFKTNLLAMINSLNNYVAGLPVSAFTSAVIDPKGTLVGILNVAANYAQDGDFDAVKETMEEDFMPYVDGYSGGDSSDDLIVDYTAQTQTYEKAQNVVTTVSITSVAIAPASATVSTGATQNFTATCTYSGQYTEDCTDGVDWTSSNTSAGKIDEAGVFTGVAEGETTISARLGSLSSNTAIATVVSPYFTDTFKNNYFAPEKWNDFSNSGTISVVSGVLKMMGTQNDYSELASTNYFTIDPGDLMTMEVDLDLANSSGEYYVQGFGLCDNEMAGIAVGIAGGTVIGNTMIYYSSPLRGEGGSIESYYSSGKFKIVYQNGTATLYRNGTQLVSFAADLEGKRLSFFLFATAGMNTSNYKTGFDNFATNQSFPGGTRIGIANESSPFGADGSGRLSYGDTYAITVVTSPGLTDVSAGLVDPDTLSYIVEPEIMTETSVPGTYELTGVLPPVSSPKIAAVATDDNFKTIALHTRRISTGVISASAISGRAVRDNETHPLYKLFPADILPAGLR